MMRTANPTLSSRTFSGLSHAVPAEAMTLQGTVNRTFVMLALVVLTASWTWNQFWASGDPAAVRVWMGVGVFGGLVLALATVFKKTWSPVTAPLYALLEGLFLGGLSAVFEARFPGIVIQAVSLTFATTLALLLAYRSGLIRVTDNFRLGIVAATGGICLIYVTTMILGFVGIRVPYIHESGLIGIAFSLFVVVVAALNLVLDFDFIEKGAERGAPKYMEWYAAFGLMVTLIWLYVEILRLLSKLNQRR